MDTGREDPIVKLLAGRAARNGPPPGPCPDDQTLSAFAESRLEGAEAAAVEDHVARCAACCEVVAALSAPDAGGVAPQIDRLERRSRFSPRLAAGILVAIGLVIGGFALRSRLSGGTPRALDGQLIAQANELRRKDPARFGDFRPFSLDELNGLGRDALRSDGGARPVYPVRKILEARPPFRLAFGPDHGEGTIVVTAARSGAEVLRVPLPPRSGVELVVAYPPAAAALEPGVAYLWEAGGEVARFEVASEAERAAFLDKVARIESADGDALRSLLKAQLALRLDMLGEAERYARACAELAPDDPLARAMLGALRRILGTESGGG